MNKEGQGQRNKTQVISGIVMCAIAAAAGCPSAGFAQTLASGRYVGSYVQDTQPPYRNVGVVLTISRVESQKVQGAASVTGGYCPGEWTVEGTTEGNKLTLKSVKGPARQGCSFDLNGDVQGDVIQANVEGNAFRLKK